MAIDSQPDDFLAGSDATQVVNIDADTLDGDNVTALDNVTLANDCMCTPLPSRTSRLRC